MRDLRDKLDMGENVDWSEISVFVTAALLKVFVFIIYRSCFYKSLCMLVHQSVDLSVCKFDTGENVDWSKISVFVTEAVLKGKFVITFSSQLHSHIYIP